MSTTVLNILQTQLIPWIENDGLEQIVVARAKLKEMKRRKNFGYVPQKLRGPRVGVRSFEFMLTTAKWPQDHLLETPTPLLSFVIDGEADFHVGDYWLHLNTGQGIFTPGDVPRKDGSVPHLHPKNRKKGFCTVINFSEARGRLGIWLSRSEGSLCQGFKLPPPIYVLEDQALQLLNQMQYHLVARDANDSTICRHLMTAFLLTLQEDLQADRALQIGVLRNSQALIFDNYDPVAKAQDYVRTHLHESLTLQYVARQVNMSRTQFALHFHKETGKTFNEFVTECRMQQARALLTETDYTLTFVSITIGYKSLTYFKRIFTDQCGQSPHDFRKNRRKTE